MVHRLIYSSSAQLYHCFLFRNLVEGWQEHYRMAMSITSPDLRALRDQPKKGRYINSAKSSPGGGGLVIIESISTQVPRPSVSSRVPSAPVGKFTRLQLASNMSVVRNAQAYIYVISNFVNKCLIIQYCLLCRKKE